MTDEEKEELNELRKYQNWFARQINSKDWDLIAERVSELHIDIIGRVMRAEKPSEINYVIWSQLDYIKDRVRNIRKSLN